MAILFGSGKKLITNDGIPYMWNSGDVTTAPSEEIEFRYQEYGRSGNVSAAGTDRITGISTTGIEVDQYILGPSGVLRENTQVTSVGIGSIGIGLTALAASSSGVFYFGLYDNKIFDLNASSYDNFGESVAVGNGKIVVSAPNAVNNGAIFLYDLDGTNGDYLTYPPPSHFRGPVAIGCSRVIIGSAFNTNSNKGSAYIYDLDGNQLGIITASDGAVSDYFGDSVAVGFGRIVVGAWGKDVNGNLNQGSAYIFDLDGNEVNILNNSNFNGGTGDNFGKSVAVGSNEIVVGAYNQDINGNERQGAAYIFDLDGNQLGIITASDGAAYDRFGISVAVGSGRIVVGAYGADNSNGQSVGATYIFDLDGKELKKIIPFDGDGTQFDNFGYSVAVGSGRIVVGANNAGINTTGKVYVFDLDGNEVGILTAYDGATNDDFGYSVAVDNGKIVVGARQHNDLNEGAVYIYDTPLVYNLYDAIDLNYDYG